MKVIGENKWFLTKLETCATRRNSHYKPGKSPMAEEIIGPEAGEPITVVLNGHYTHRSVLFSLQQTAAINAKIHKWSKCWESLLSAQLYLGHLYHELQRNNSEEKMERLPELGGQGGVLRNAVFWTVSQCTYGYLHKSMPTTSVNIPAGSTYWTQRIV